MAKPYNSYILDKLWIGSDVKNNPQDSDGRMQLQKFLFDHGLDKSSMEQLLKGTCPKRSFISLEGQMYRGKIKGLKSDDEGRATTVVIEADIGEMLFIEASRENIFVYGHWMGKADLRYLFDQGMPFKNVSWNYCLTYFIFILFYDFKIATFDFRLFYALDSFLTIFQSLGINFISSVCLPLYMVCKPFQLRRNF